MCGSTVKIKKLRHTLIRTIRLFAVSLQNEIKHAKRLFSALRPEAYFIQYELVENLSL